jgi:hypothetical protein
MSDITTPTGDQPGRREGLARLAALVRRQTAARRAAAIVHPGAMPGSYVMTLADEEAFTDDDLAALASTHEHARMLRLVADETGHPLAAYLARVAEAERDSGIDTMGDMTLNVRSRMSRLRARMNGGTPGYLVAALRWFREDGYGTVGLGTVGRGWLADTAAQDPDGERLRSYVRDTLGV